MEAASRDPRTYLLVLLLLETGLKKAELLTLNVADFDFSNRYQPELWVRHSGREVYKDRRLRLPAQLAEVFDDYVDRYGISGRLFAYTQRFLSQLIAETAEAGCITKQVTASRLRDAFVLRSVKRGMKLDDVFGKLGLAKNSYEDARRKYVRLTAEAL